MLQLKIKDVISVIERHYPNNLAESWDNTGLLLGDENQEIDKIYCCVDVTRSTINDAISWGANLMVAHHPLFFRPLKALNPQNPKADMAITAIKSGLGIIAAHTNADTANPGVSDALAKAIGLENITPLERKESCKSLLKLVTFVPTDYLVELQQALAKAGAGAIGAYDSCAFVTNGTGYFRPKAQAQPHLGEIGKLNEVAEAKLEVIFPKAKLAEIMAVHHRVHPYEEPAFDLLELVDLPQNTGIGRIGTLHPSMTAKALANHLAKILPDTISGVRLAGDPEREITKVALVGGAGDSHLDYARNSGADAYITSDLRHHPVLDAIEYPNAPVFLDISHWAAESLWLTELKEILARELNVEIKVSQLRTEPWSYRA